MSMLVPDLTKKPEMEFIQTNLYRYTFKNKKIKSWVESNCNGLTLNLFAGLTKLGINEIRNDVDKKALADYHCDALQFVKGWMGDKFNTVILDPPYSYRKSMEMYGGRISSPFNELKDALCNIVTDGCNIITFGYQSVNMGLKRYCTLEKILVMSHGGAIHDTLVSVEKFNYVLKLINGGNNYVINDSYND